MVSGNFRLTPGDEKFPVLFDAGKGATAIWFSCDNSYADTAHAIVAAPQQSLRVAVVDTSGNVQTTVNVLVGRDPKNGLKPVAVKFPNAKTANMVSITPGPNGPSDQRITFCVA